MKLLIPTVLAVATASSLVAQSPLSTTYDGATFLNSGQLYFDLVVNTTVTISGIEVNTLSAVGTTGTIELWVTNPGTTTFLGNELNAAVWSQAASGSCTAAAAGTPSIACLSPAVTLQPGTYGIAVNHVGLAPLYTAGNGTVVPGGGGATTNQTYANNELTLLAGAAQATPFSVAVNIPRVFNGALVYTVGSSALPCSNDPAGHESYGNGCYRVQGSFWEGFDAAGAAATLSGRALSMLPTGSGYLVMQPAGVGYLPPTAAATTLAGFAPSSDDGELQVTLPSPLPLGDGTIASSLWVHTNGIVSTGANDAALQVNYFPQLADMLDAPNTAWWSWHDYNIDEGGAIKTELVGQLFCVTWENVESYATTQVNPSTLQMQFDLGSGQVNFVWDSITPINSGAASDLHLIGWSPGGTSLDHGADDVTVIDNRVLSMSADQFPLTLTAAPRPITGSTVTYTTANESSNPGLGLFVLSTGQISPGVDLGVLGAAGCEALVDLGTGVGSVIANITGFSMDVALPIPLNAALAGADLFAQSVWLDPTQNAFGAITSNGLRSHLGTF
ncbi:MAG: hypothetical protein R3F29_11120 [Planctomycetota bacterium]